MKIYEDFEIDYEQMDDLPLSEHIDWQHIESNEEITVTIIEDESETRADVPVDRSQLPTTLAYELIEHSHLTPSFNSA